MKLHENRDLFLQAVKETSAYFGMPQAIIEKDYYVTLILRELAGRIPGLIFKGGTSLSKCYHIIERFSEDIDLTLDAGHHTQRQRQNVKAAVISVCDLYGMRITNAAEIKSRRDHNRYTIEYSPVHSYEGLSRELLIETTFMQDPYPNETRTASSAIFDFLLKNGNDNIIAEYGLQPFEIGVQSLKRTLIDKVFALCDYMLVGRTERISRHIYDLFRLLTAVDLNDELKALVRDVRRERKGGLKNLSAKDGADVPGLLSEMLEKEFFKSDYEQNTMLLLRTPIPYEEAAKALEEIIASGIFKQ